MVVSLKGSGVSFGVHFIQLWPRPRSRGSNQRPSTIRPNFSACSLVGKHTTFHHSPSWATLWPRSHAPCARRADREMTALAGRAICQGYSLSTWAGDISPFLRDICDQLPACSHSVLVL